MCRNERPAKEEDKPVHDLINTSIRKEVKAVDGADAARNSNKKRAASFYSDPIQDLRSLDKYVRTSTQDNIPSSEQVWRFFFGTAAMLELCSYVIPYLFLNHDEEDEEDDEGVPLGERLRSFFLHWNHPPTEEEVEPVQLTLWTIPEWLDENRYKLGVLFSVMWFVNAFVAAARARRVAIERKDREVLLSEEEVGEGEEGKSELGKSKDDESGAGDNGKKKGDESAKNVTAEGSGAPSDKSKSSAESTANNGAKSVSTKSIVLKSSDAAIPSDAASSSDTASLSDVASSSDSSDTYYTDMAYIIGGSWGVFFSKLTWYLLLLPVGFYLLSLTDLLNIVMLGKSDAGHGDTDQDELAVNTEEEDAAHFTDRVIHKETKYCLAYATFIYMLKSFSLIVSTAVKSRTVRWGKKLARRMAMFSIRNPRTARRRIIKSLTAVRWAKYLAPLIGTGNKLRGNTMDLMKKYKQARDASKAKKIRKRMKKELKTPEQQMEYAALVVQRNFRAHSARRRERAMRLVVMRRRDAAILRIQTRLRKKAAEARIRVMMKKKELRELEEKRMAMDKKGGRGHGGAKMSASERRRIYMLQDELGLEFKKGGIRGMLLRPNTRFAVMWKIIFVVCVVLEITQLAVSPKLAKMKDATTGEPLDAQKVLEKYLVPTPVAEWEQCVDPEEEKRRKKEMKMQRRKTKSRKRAAAMTEAITKEDDSDGTSEVTHYYGPWYCSEPYRTLTSILSKTVRFLIAKFIILIGIVCFLDVFITFFTGELDEETGVLGPKDFFTRWILPGIVLQLLVNPMMLEVTHGLQSLRRGVHYIGPARVWRWSTAFILPSFAALMGWFEWNVWRRFVMSKNKETV